MLKNISIIRAIRVHIANAFPRTRIAAIDVTQPNVQVCLGNRGQLVFRGNVTPYHDHIVLSAPGQEDIHVPAPLTLEEARARLGDEMTLAHKDGEYRVNVRGGTEATASYHSDLWDAVHTGEHMRDNRADPHWQRTAHGVYRAGRAACFWSIEQGHEFWSAYVGNVHVGTFCSDDPRRDIRDNVLEEAMRACGKPHGPINQSAHDGLTALGYKHTHTPAEFDDGDAENGPGHGGHDAFDTYESDIDYVIIDVHGHFVHHELRDLSLERFLEAQS